jgi:hypothetical protein
MAGVKRSAPRFTSGFFWEVGSESQDSDGDRGHRRAAGGDGRVREQQFELQAAD